MVFSFALVEPINLEEDFPILRVGDAMICFHLADEKVFSGRAGSVAYWQVKDFDRTIAHAEEMGGSVYRGPLEIGTGDRICQILDPFGNLFGLIG